MFSGLSSSRNHYGQRVITREADLVTAHEFGHNWGSEHDPDSNECSPSASQVSSFVHWVASQIQGRIFFYSWIRQIGVVNMTLTQMNVHLQFICSLSCSWHSVTNLNSGQIFFFVNLSNWGSEHDPDSNECSPLASQVSSFCSLSCSRHSFLFHKFKFRPTGQIYFFVNSSNWGSEHDPYC